MSVIRVVVTVALLTIGGVWFFTFRPGFLGGPAAYVMVSGKSMEPTLRTGDLVVTQKQGAYAAGDIVAFHVPRGEPAEGGIVIHRIVGGSAEEGFVVQGDNKNGPDPWHPTKDDVVGKMWFSVPGAGRFMARLRQPLPLATLLGSLAMLFVLVGEPGSSQWPTRVWRPVGPHLPVYWLGASPSAGRDIPPWLWRRVPP